MIGEDPRAIDDFFLAAAHIECRASTMVVIFLTCTSWDVSESLHSMWAPDKKKSSIDLGSSPIIAYSECGGAVGQEFSCKSGYIPRNFFFSPVVNYGPPFLCAQPCAPAKEKNKVNFVNKVSKLHNKNCRIYHHRWVQQTCHFGRVILGFYLQSWNRLPQN